MDKATFEFKFGQELVYSTPLSDGRLVELIPGGSSVIVHYEERMEFIHLVQKARLEESREQVQHTPEDTPVHVWSHLDFTLYTCSWRHWRASGHLPWTHLGGTEYTDTHLSTGGRVCTHLGEPVHTRGPLVIPTYTPGHVLHAPEETPQEPEWTSINTWTGHLYSVWKLEK